MPAPEWNRIRVGVDCVTTPRHPLRKGPGDEMGRAAKRRREIGVIKP
ncbi:hypothetical protein FHR23_001631 [Stakelama sediminis]|uniref:Uncharacterized protein n=1 Tax=Stakelama sediminis TaxID=463200 RepID=A0A840YYF8_9SPHN|nr:hypothetical protein [Stakelama sediminis]